MWKLVTGIPCVVYLALPVTWPSERENGVTTCSSTACVVLIM